MYFLLKYVYYFIQIGNIPVLQDGVTIGFNDVTSWNVWKSGANGLSFVAVKYKIKVALPLYH